MYWTLQTCILLGSAMMMTVANALPPTIVAREDSTSSSTTGPTALGPLTSVFTMPSSCAASFLTDFKLVGGWDVMGPVSTGDGCYPTSYDFATTAHYSPAQCPAGFSAACQTNSVVIVSETIYSVTGETCCPSGYTCISTAVTLSNSVYACNSRILDFTGLQMSISDGSTVASSSIIIRESQAWIANAFGIAIQYQATDFASTIPVSTTPTSTSPISDAAVSASTTASTSSGRATGSASPTSTSHGISAGAAAGIGVVCSFVVVAAIATGIYFRLRKRLSTKLLSPAPQIANINQPYELSAKTKPLELDGTSNRLIRG